MTTIHRLFEAQVQRQPEAIALRLSSFHPAESHPAALSYEELNRWANRLAHHLQRLGVGPETLVGVCLEPSLERVVALLAILKAGGAYLPLDPAYPASRLAFMLADSGAPFLLTQTHLLDRLPPHTAQVITLDLNDSLLDG